jgi:hypothetical protein
MKITLVFYKRLLYNLYDGVYIVNRNREIVTGTRGRKESPAMREMRSSVPTAGTNILMHVDAQGNHLCQRGCPLLAGNSV